MIQVDKATEDHFNQVIENYEKKLQQNTLDFQLSKFEKIIMKEAMIYGYEYAQFMSIQNIKMD